MRSGVSESQSLKEVAEVVSRMASAHRRCRESCEEERRLLSQIQEKLRIAEEGTTALIDLAEAIQNETHGQIADIVTRCLHAVFDESYQFAIQVEKKRGKAEARLLLTHHGNDVDPLEDESGGVADVAAFGLRLAALLLSRPRLRRLLVLDEPFRFLAKKNLPKLATLVESLAKEMDVQIVMVTHERELQLGEVVEL